MPVSLGSEGEDIKTFSLDKGEYTSSELLQKYRALTELIGEQNFDDLVLELGLDFTQCACFEKADIDFINGYKSGIYLEEIPGGPYPILLAAEKTGLFKSRIVEIQGKPKHLVAFSGSDLFTQVVVAPIEEIGFDVSDGPSGTKLNVVSCGSSHLYYSSYLNERESKVFNITAFLKQLNAVSKASIILKETDRTKTSIEFMDEYDPYEASVKRLITEETLVMDGVSDGRVVRMVTSANKPNSITHKIESTKDSIEAFAHEIGHLMLFALINKRGAGDLYLTLHNRIDENLPVEEYTENWRNLVWERRVQLIVEEKKAWELGIGVLIKILGTDVFEKMSVDYAKTANRYLKTYEDRTGITKYYLQPNETDDVRGVFCSNNQERADELAKKTKALLSQVSIGKLPLVVYRHGRYLRDKSYLNIIEETLRFYEQMVNLGVAFEDAVRIAKRSLDMGLNPKDVPPFDDEDGRPLGILFKQSVK